jgi:hypothetical protein
MRHRARASKRRGNEGCPGRFGRRFGRSAFGNVSGPKRPERGCRLVAVPGHPRREPEISRASAIDSGGLGSRTVLHLPVDGRGAARTTCYLIRGRGPPSRGSRLPPASPDPRGRPFGGREWVEDRNIFRGCQGAAARTLQPPNISRATPRPSAHIFCTPEPIENVRLLRKCESLD